MFAKSNAEITKWILADIEEQLKIVAQNMHEVNTESTRTMVLLSSLTPIVENLQKEYI